MSGEGLTVRLPGRGVPQPHRLILAAGGQQPPVGTERHPPHRAGVSGQQTRRVSNPGQPADQPARRFRSWLLVPGQAEALQPGQDRYVWLGVNQSL